MFMPLNLRFPLWSTGRPGFPLVDGKEEPAAGQDRKQEVVIP